MKLKTHLITSAILAITILTVTACGGSSESNSDNLPIKPNFSRKNITNSQEYSPSGNVSQVTPTFSWNAIPNASNYRFGHEATDDDSQWHEYFTSPEAAGCQNTGDICQYTPNDYSFPLHVEKVWWIQAKVNGEWKDWSRPIIFTVIENNNIATPPRPGRATGQFRVNCNYVKSERIDPIVSPGIQSHHRHQFLGNTNINALSTPESLRTGNTLCTDIEDRSSYWFPAVHRIDNGEEIIPTFANVYYKGITNNGIKAIPANLRMITLNDSRSKYFSCDNQFHALKSRTNFPQYPRCISGKSSISYIFPDCWDGRNVDSANHRSHMAISNNGKCSATHPIPLPRIMVVVHYEKQLSRSTHRLSSGSFDTAHADFMNGWNMNRLRKLVDDCIYGNKTCRVNN